MVKPEKKKIARITWKFKKYLTEISGKKILSRRKNIADIYAVTTTTTFDY